MMPFILIVLFCGLFVCVGIYQWRKQNTRKEICTAQVFGRVAEINKREEVDEEGRSVTYSPVFAYTVNGYEYRREFKAASSFCRWKLGDEVTVFYDPIDPQDSYVLEDKAGNLTGVLFAFFGALGIILAIIFKASGAI